MEPAMTKEEFHANDLRQFEWGIDEFDKDADFKIKNNNTLFALRQEIIKTLLKNNLND